MTPQLVLLPHRRRRRIRALRRQSERSRRLCRVHRRQERGRRSSDPAAAWGRDGTATRLCANKARPRRARRHGQEGALEPRWGLARLQLCVAVLPKPAHPLQTSSSPSRATLPRAPLPVYTLPTSSFLERSCSVLYQYLLHRARHGTTRSENGRRRDEISTYGQSARLTRRESMSLELRRTCGILSARPSDASPRPCSR